MLVGPRVLGDSQRTPAELRSTMPLPSAVSAIVFDCDGLLLDTESCWSRAETSLFADYGFGFGPAEKDILIGRTLEAACDDMAINIGQPGAGHRLQSELLPRVEAGLALAVEAMPGARDLLERLAGRVHSPSPLTAPAPCSTPP